MHNFTKEYLDMKLILTKKKKKNVLGPLITVIPNSQTKPLFWEAFMCDTNFLQICLNCTCNSIWLQQNKAVQLNYMYC